MHILNQQEEMPSKEMMTMRAKPSFGLTARKRASAELRRYKYFMIIFISGLV